LDTFVVMPNHVHGIVVFVGAGLALPLEIALSCQEGAASSAPTLGDVMRAFKSLSALRVNRRMMRTGRLWQRNYFEHVIRDEEDLNLIRQYILGNPARWEEDENHPDRLRQATCPSYSKRTMIRPKRGPTK